MIRQGDSGNDGFPHGVDEGHGNLRPRRARKGARMNVQKRPARPIARPTPKGIITETHDHLRPRRREPDLTSDRVTDS